MAKERGEMVEVPASTLAQLQARLDLLESRERLREEALQRPTQVLDEAWAAWKEAVARPAVVRTQEAADATYGTAAPRWRVELDSTDDTGKKINVSEHFPLVLSANSDLEAQARYQAVMGIRKHDYKLVTTVVA